MNSRHFLACLTGVIAVIGLAEGWLLAAGVVTFSDSSISAVGGDDCNKSDKGDVDCLLHPEAPPGTKCGGKHLAAYILSGNDKDLLSTIGDGKVCKEDNCINEFETIVTTKCVQDPGT